MAQSETDVEASIADVDGWLSIREAQFLFETARMCSSDGVILEIGLYKGRSTICLAKGSLAGNRVTVHAIDPHVGSIEQALWLGGQSSFAAFQANIARARVETLVIPIVQTSAQAAEHWHRPISFLWIDGDHSYKGAKLDFELYSPWVTTGGIVAFHDATQGDLPRAVRHSFESRQFSRIRLIDSIAAATRLPNARKTVSDRLSLFALASYATWRRVPGARRFKDIVKSALSRI